MIADVWAKPGAGQKKALNIGELGFAQNMGGTQLQIDQYLLGTRESGKW